ncbi:MAG: hypothetical protein ACRD3Q_08000 [Terriglobales bacterium]
MRYLIYLFWVLPPAVLGFLAVMMFRRKLNVRYPFFYAYIVFQILDFVAQFSVYHLWPSQYYFEYLTASALSICISFAVIYELFTQVFEPFDGLRDLGGVLFSWAAVILVLAAALMALTSSGIPHVSIRAAILLAFERSVRVMQCGIVLLMILCAPCVGLTPKHRIFGIASGFGIMAALDLIMTAVVARLGVTQATNTWFSLIHTASFCAAVGIWTNYLLRPEPARAPVLQIAPSERWNFALSVTMHPETAAPSLPLIMGAVDRTFDRLQARSRHAVGPTHADQ